MSTGLQFAINIVAIIIGPIVAVLITVWYQQRNEKRRAKIRLFLNLMAHRKSNPPSISWVESLNLIDVVYADHPNIVHLWHQYYDMLCNHSVDNKTREHKYLDLLSSMGKILGYNNLQQTDIDKFYAPQAHVDQNELNYKVQTEFLRVLQETRAFKMYPNKNDQT